MDLFSGGGRDGLTHWDRAYLEALYSPRYRRVLPGAHQGAVANRISKTRRQAVRAE